MLVPRSSPNGKGGFYVIWVKCTVSKSAGVHKPSWGCGSWEGGDISYTGSWVPHPGIWADKDWHVNTVFPILAKLKDCLSHFTPVHILGKQHKGTFSSLRAKTKFMVLWKLKLLGAQRQACTDAASTPEIRMPKQQETPVKAGITIAKNSSRQC